MRISSLPRDLENPMQITKRTGSIPPRSTRGSAPIAGVFWLFGIALFALPFLRDPDAADPEGDDPGRLVSEIDIAFDEDVAVFEEEIGLELGAFLTEASDEWFGLDSRHLRSSGLIERRRVEPGRRAYQALCVGCHGDNGDGAGPAARHLVPRPRNFRRGLFKFTSTGSGERPLRGDFFDTITRGLTGSSMPSFVLVAEEVRWDLVEYVRYLSIKGEFEQLALDLAWEEEELPDAEEVAEIVVERWSEENCRPTYPSAPENDYDEASIARGREVYLDRARANCAACHGDEGEGDGPSATGFLDGWGYPVQPRDLTSGVFRAGSTAADLYRSIATGINGTPMPAFGGTLSAEEIWDLVHYTQSLGPENGPEN